MNKIIVKSRRETELMPAYSGPWAAISITDPRSSDALVPTDNLVGILRPEVRRQHVDVAVVSHHRPPVPVEQARQILAFAKRVWPKADVLLVHCEAGISRSAGAAAALSRLYFGEDAEFFLPPYRPNSARLPSAILDLSLPHPNHNSIASAYLTCYWSTEPCQTIAQNLTAVSRSSSTTWTLCSSAAAKSALDIDVGLGSIDLLELMENRRRQMGSDDCFIIFDDREDPDGPAADHLHESEALVRESVLEGVVWDGGTGSASLDEAIVVDLPAEGWRGDDSQLRFIQFRFNERSFDLDIPNTTLYRAEAEVILRRRSGFFYAVERLDLERPTKP